MFNNQNTDIKIQCLEDMKASKMKVGKFCHDLSCGIGPRIEGKLCSKSFLNDMHAKKHKYAHRRIEYKPNLNSAASEQLWSRLDKLGGFVTEMTGSHYMYFGYLYCKSRNDYGRSLFYGDATTPLASRKRMKRRGK